MPVTVMSRTCSTSSIQREVIQANGQRGSNQKSAFLVSEFQLNRRTKADKRPAQDLLQDPHPGLERWPGRIRAGAGVGDPDLPGAGSRLGHDHPQPAVHDPPCDLAAGRSSRWPDRWRGDPGAVTRSATTPGPRLPVAVTRRSGRS